MEFGRNKGLIVLAVFVGAVLLLASHFVSAPQASAQSEPFDCFGTRVVGTNNQYQSDPTGVGPVVVFDSANPAIAETLFTQQQLLADFATDHRLTDVNNAYFMRSPNQIALSVGGERMLLTAFISERATDANGNLVDVTENTANGDYIIDYSLTGGENYYVLTPNKGVGGAVNPVDGLYYHGKAASPDAGQTSPVFLRYRTYMPGSGDPVSTNEVVYQWPSEPADEYPPGGAGDYLFDNDGRLTVLTGSGTDLGDKTWFGYQSEAVGTGPYTGFKKITEGPGTSLDGLAFGPQGELWLSSLSGIVSIDPFEGQNLIPQIQQDGWTDLGDCVGAKLITLQKSFPAGRFAPSDQVTLELSQVFDDPIENPRVETLTTTGSDKGIQDDKIGPFPVIVGSTFKISESGATGTDLTPYLASYECVIADGTVLSSGELNAANDYSVEIDIANAPNTVCTITNDLSSGLTLEKSVASIDGSAAGAKINYAFKVTNTGDQTISNIVLFDPLIDNESCPKLVLAPGEDMDCTGSYTLSQDDVDSCVVDNKATVNGTNQADETVTAESEVSAPLMPKADLSVTKVGTPTDPNGNGLLDLGEVVDYEITVENTGEETVDGLAVSDPNADSEPVCPEGALAPGDSATCTASHTVTEQDVVAGEIVNEATATATGLCSKAEVPATGGTIVDVDQPAAIEVVKSGVPADGKEANDLVAGDIVNYTFNVTNTGYVTLTDVKVVDTVVPEVTCPADTLAPGASFECSGAYELTQDDIDNRGVVNVATASGVDPAGNLVDAEDPEALDITRDDPLNLKLTKTGEPVDVDGDGFLEAGEFIDYTIVVENIGNVTISDLKVDDSKAGPPNCGGVTVLAPGESVTCTVRYTVVQADVDAGEVLNVATATGRTPDGQEVSDEDDDLTDIELPPGMIALDKIAPAGTLNVGDTVTYEFMVTNTGTVPLTDVAVTDSMVPEIECPKTELAPNETMKCTGDYVVEQTDLDAGKIMNTADATGKDPSGNTVGDKDTVEFPTNFDPQLDFSKRAPVGEVAEGNTLTYEFVVVNTGVVTLSDLVVVDSLITNVSCPVTELAPGQTATCLGTYVVTAQDIEAGNIINTATATVKDPNGNEIKRQDNQRVDIQKPNVIIIEKPKPPVVKPTPMPPVKPTPPIKPKPPLAVTGSNPIAPAAVAAGLVLLGFTALGVTRKRLF